MVITTFRLSSDVLALDRACGYTFDDVFLTSKIEYYHWYNCHDKAGHDRTHVNTTIRTLHVLNNHGDRIVFIAIECQIWQQEVVPDPHRLKNSDRYVCRLHD